MSDVLMVLFEILPDGNQQVISSQTFSSRDEALEAFDHMSNSIFVAPGCHNYQVDLVDRQSITELVEVYIPNTDAAIAWGNETWASWKALKTGDIVTVALGGDFTNSHPADTDCRVPEVPKLDDFSPTPDTGGPAPAVPLSLAVAPSTAADPTPAPLPAQAPVNVSTALVAVPAASHELALTGAGYQEPLAALAIGLVVVGAAIKRLGKSFVR